jgi:hypothetical protein
VKGRGHRGRTPGLLSSSEWLVFPPGILPWRSGFSSEHDGRRALPSDRGFHSFREERAGVEMLTIPIWADAMTRSGFFEVRKEHMS